MDVFPRAPRLRGTHMDDRVVEMRGIGKEFPGVKALDNVDFHLKRGEIHALMGENGAGKSTLIKIMTGMYRPDAGGIFLVLRSDD